jgi:hypothetical protein
MVRVAPRHDTAESNSAEPLPESGWAAAVAVEVGAAAAVGSVVAVAVAVGAAAGSVVAVAVAVGVGADTAYGPG